MTWTVGSEELDPTAGGVGRCAFDMRAENITVCGFSMGFFKCFYSTNHVVRLGMCQRRVLTLVTFAKDFIGQRGFDRGFINAEVI